MHLAEFLAHSMYSKVLAVIIMEKFHTYELFNPHSYSLYKCKKGSSVICLGGKWWYFSQSWSFDSNYRAFYTTCFPPPSPPNPLTPCSPLSNKIWARCCYNVCCWYNFIIAHTWYSKLILSLKSLMEHLSKVSITYIYVNLRMVTIPEWVPRNNSEDMSNLNIQTKS